MKYIYNLFFKNFVMDIKMYWKFYLTFTIISILYSWTFKIDVMLGGVVVGSTLLITILTFGIVSFIHYKKDKGE